MSKLYAPEESYRYGVRSVALLQSLRWLQAGWRDFARCPLPGLLHGLALAAFGALLFWTLRQHFWWLAGAFSGFLLVAPVLATGIYASSRALERGERADGVERPGGAGDPGLVAAQQLGHCAIE